MNMDLDEAIRGRRSIREYEETGVPEKLVRQVIEAATFAPSAKNGQQWRFTVLAGAAKSALTDRFKHELERLCKRRGGRACGVCVRVLQRYGKAPRRDHGLECR